MGYDVIVIGGGINGVGIFRDLSLRGVKVLLLEKVDFGWATTSASSRLIHGGARYILHDITVTYHSSKDAGILTKIAPHLLFRRPFLIPAKGLMKHLFDTYMLLYDIFSRMRKSKSKILLTESDVEVFTGGVVKNHKGGVLVEEYGTNPLRLSISAVLSAPRGKTINHAKVISVERKNGIFEVKYVKGGKVYVETARVVVNATGPWVDTLTKNKKARLRPTKGIHIVFPGKVLNTILSFPAIDGRYLLFVPLEDETILGTTDDDYFGDRDDISITDDEVQYLIRSAEKFIPSIRDLVPYSTTVGLRPTPYVWGVMEDKITRDYEIVDEDGFISVLGGKLASFRLLSEIVSDIVSKKIGVNVKSSSHKERFYGAEEYDEKEDFEKYAERIAKNIYEKYGIDFDISLRLSRKYGVRAFDVLDKKSSYSFDVVCRCRAVLLCEIIYSLKKELAETLDDVSRRTGLGDGLCNGVNCVLLASEIMKGEGFEPNLKDFLKRRLKLAQPIKNISPSYHLLKSFYDFVVGEDEDFEE